VELVLHLKPNLPSNVNNKALSNQVLRPQAYLLLVITHNTHLHSTPQVLLVDGAVVVLQAQAAFHQCHMVHHRPAGFLDLGKAFLPDRFPAMVASHQDNKGTRHNSKVNHQNRLQLVQVHISNPPLLQPRLLRSNLNLKAWLNQLLKWLLDQ
jgi:hypothetical protein